MAGAPLVPAVGWALLHFVWQGAGIALVTGCALRLLRGASPQVRYALACCALAAMLAVPGLTGGALYMTGSAATAPVAGASGEVVSAAFRVFMSGAVADAMANGGTGVGALLAGSGLGADRVLSWVVLLWLAGVLALTLRGVAGLVGVRAVRRGCRPADPAWQQRASELAALLGVGRAAELLESTRLHVPMVVGWLRPVILVPATAMTGLSPRQLELILLHELAHIRRHDHLVNLFQVVVETLLFYNPAVWWLSDRNREEREHCCDDVAVAASGEALGYARALIELEELREAPRLAVAASGGSLVRRVRRLLGFPAPVPPPGRWAAGVLALALLAIGAAVHARPLPAGPSESDTLVVIVQAGQHGATRTGTIVAALAGHHVTGVYSTGDRRTLEMARPLADGLAVPRIPYDYDPTDPARFARTLLAPDGLERVPGGTAVLVLPRPAIGPLLAEAGAAGTPPARHEILLIRGSASEPRIDRVRVN